MYELAVVSRFGGRLFWRDRMVLASSVAVTLGVGTGLPLLIDKVGAPPADVLAQHIGMVPILLGIASMGHIATVLTARRDQLILKRMRATGLSDRAILGGEIVNTSVQAVLLLAASSLVLYALTGLSFPRNPLMYLLALAGGASVLAVLGTAFTAFVRRAELAGPMTMPFYFLAGMGAGGFGPLDKVLPEWLLTALDLLPTGAVVDLVRTAYAADGTLTGDLRAAAVPALTLAVWAAVGLFAIMKWFRWEARRS
ncbi:ABC transporter permease [Streptosporangium minutum]|uniref:ABC-2 type transporter transmembrane domain-containing protein n=1 Tax=Streptosporangium minutum TaxID=569862 RepID=A0A243RI07_9ACTN|nr:ABC transporter permease [Streptosporangium minutum]OUC94416.1 hypothetical protein CA984_22515 [Streptosporangium minutum]